MAALACGVFALGFHKEGGKRSVEMIVDWHRRPGFREAYLRDLSVDIIGDSFVFFRFDAASAVNEPTAGLQELNGCLDDPPLKMLHPRKVLRSQTPSDIGPPPDHPGICARNVDEDCIESFRLEW